MCEMVIFTLQTRVRRVVTFAVLTVPTSGCFLKILSAALRYLTEKVHFTRLILVHFFSISHLKEQELAQKPVEGKIEEEEREEP